LNLFRVTGVGGETNNDLVGHPTDLIISLARISQGGKITQYWWVPSSNGKGDNIADVDFSVEQQTATVKGAQLKVWRLSYTGEVIGWYANDNDVYSKGPATQTSLYDSVYGIEVAYSFKSNTNGAEVGSGGTWSEAYSDDYQLDDTNLSFTPQVTVSSQTTTGAAVTGSGTTIAATTSTATSSTSPSDSTLFYIFAGGLVTVIIVLVVTMMRRRTAAPQPPQTTSAVTTSAAPVREKFCINCGSRIPASLPFCPRCGQRQS
jgi:hypothetical protein